MRIKRQAGVTTVEFAYIGVAMLLVILGIIELGRAMFVLNALGESTRRAARMAAVCPVGDPAIAEVGVFNAPGQGSASAIVRGLSTGNLAIDYLDANGGVIASPAANFSQIYYVRARIVNFQHELLIPFVTRFFNTPDFATTLRRESLGVPREGAMQPC
jgi:Flp pilus assembly protein TadG